MLARSAAIALLLILCLGAAGWAAEPHGGTIVLQLPPSMSAEAAKELIANLADKGVRPGAELSEPPPAPSPPWLTTASLGNYTVDIGGAMGRDDNDRPALETNNEVKIT
jgi:hypothetical protein